MQAETQKRKVNYRLYPTPRQTEALGVLLRSHQQLYNAALEERISAWQKAHLSISYADQCASLTVIRRDLPAWAEVNCSSQQMTLRRLDKAFAAFFRRVKSGKTPGFPRFKSLSRFPGFSFKSHGDGWRFTPGKDWKHGSLRLAGVGHITCRGQARQGGKIGASDLLHKNGQWFLSLTVEPEKIDRARTAHGAVALDWGTEYLLSGVQATGQVITINNPRWYQNSKDDITALQQAVSLKKRGSERRKQAVHRLARARARQARKRLDFLHKITRQLAQNHALVAMEELSIKNMTHRAQGTVNNPGKNVAQKAGLNREILDTAPALLMQLLRYKVLDTGGMWAEAPTRKLKPSQTCPECGHVRKKSLSERTHRCASCGHTEPRDTASARVVLNWALFGTPTAPQSRQELTAAGFTPCETPSNRSATWLE